MSRTQRIVAGVLAGVASLAPAASAAGPACSVETTSPVVILLSNPPRVVIHDPPYVSVSCP